MRTSRRMHASLLTVALTVFAMAVSLTWVAQLPGMARAAPVVGPGGGGSVQPRLTTNTNAPCNTKPKKRHAQCFAVVRTPADHEITPTADEPPPTALGPADIQNAYRLNGGGQDQSVAIVDAYGYSNAEDDLAVFRDYYGLPPCTTESGCFKKVDQRGGTDYPQDNAGWALESALDLDAVSSACPNCNILLVEADDNGVANLGAAVEEAVALGAKYVSNSYGAGDTGDPGGADTHYDHPGVAVVASGGDVGNVVDWPSSIPTVTSVGGTRLTKDTSVPRGWDEKVWGDSTTGGVRDATGSGCSSVEPKPAYQNGVNTDCDMRATTDISADADPESGLGIYDTFGQSGWLQVGGTSLSSPLIAAMYALAGTPLPGTYPVTYPYDPPAHAHLFDITEGVNSACGTVLCTAGPGWDGPTGWGTPNGVQALTPLPHGEIAGHVTDADTGDPIAGATVRAGDYAATTDQSGAYDLSVVDGGYDVTAWAYGYADATRTGVQVTEGMTTIVDFALQTVPSSTLSGTVTDGSGHGWPLYAKIIIDDYPGGPVFTNPYTGRYTVTLAEQHTYTMRVTPVDTRGYQTRNVSVPVGTSGARQNIAVTVDTGTCTAPGYVFGQVGIQQDFTDWTDRTPQNGWTVTDNAGNGHTWRFDNPNGVAPPPGGDADFAHIYAIEEFPARPDTSLVSPTVDLSGTQSATIHFDTRFSGHNGTTASVDLSLDGGETWQVVWSKQDVLNFAEQVDVAIPEAAGHSNVQVRFHFDAPSNVFASGWALDNVRVGSPVCEAVSGGLTAGLVTDANTSNPLNGARVANADESSESSTSVATPDDTNLPDGFYELFIPGEGSHHLTATAGAYVSSTVAVDTAADTVTRQDFELSAGHLSVSTRRIAATRRLGKAVTRTLTLTNDGTAPLHLELGEQGAGFNAEDETTLTPTGASPGDASWTDIPARPDGAEDSVTASYDGTVYSVGGATQRNATSWVPTASTYAYDPVARQWSLTAPAPEALRNAASAFLGGRLYLVGGFRSTDSSGLGLVAVRSVYTYNPLSDAWSRITDLPQKAAGAGVAVLGGQLYVVGGCHDSICPGVGSPGSSAAYRYDPETDTWTRLADYPVPVAYQACAGIAGEIVCAGGDRQNPTTETARVATYVYHLDTNRWTPGADMPYGNAHMAYATVGDDLVVATGVTGAVGINQGALPLTDRAAEYDPVSDTWTELPKVNHATKYGSGACGFYLVGETGAEVLPGYDQCTTDVPWLSQNTGELDLAVGESATVSITLDSSVLAQPGDYAARLAVNTDSPYYTRSVAIALRVSPPKSWGRVTGTVTGATSGDPLYDATVLVCADYNRHTGGCGPAYYPLKTDQSGHYQWWLSRKDNPLQVSAAKDRYRPQVRVARVKPGATTTVNFALRRS